MKTFKRFLASIMVAVMVLTAAPLSGFVGLELNLDWLSFGTKASAESYSGNCGYNLTWSLDGETGELVISGTGDMYSWSSYSSVPWCAHIDLIKSVVIEKGITSIGNYAFCGCAEIASVTIPDSVISIGVEAFRYCIKLESVTIPDSVTSIGDEAFVECVRLESITIPDGVTSINYSTFVSCTRLKSITIPDSVISIGNNAFSSCDSLENVYYGGDVSAWCDINFVGVTSNPTCYADNLYFNGELVEDLIISGSVTSVGEYAFFGYQNLKAAHYLGEKSQVTVPESAFVDTPVVLHYCTLISTSCTQTETAGWYCGDCDDFILNDPDVTLPASGHDWSDQDGICARKKCGFECEHPEDEITWETVVEPTCAPGLKLGSCNVCGIGSKTETIVCDSSTYPESSHDYSNSYNNTWSFRYAGAEKLILKFSSLTETESNYDYIYLYDSAGTQIGKYSGTQLSGAEFEIEGSSFNIQLTSDYSNTNYGFKFDSITATIDGNPIEREIPAIADHDWSGKDGICANGCGTECEHSSFTQGICDVCGGICSTIGHSYDEDLKICIVCGHDCSTMGHVFNQDVATCLVCGWLAGTCGSSLTWALDKNGVLTISGTGEMTSWSSYSVVPWYNSATSIQNIVIDEGVTNIGPYAFYGCTGLTSVTIPDSVTSIGGSAFYNCSGIKELTMPISIKIYGDVFSNCTNIEKVTLTKGNGMAQNHTSDYYITPWYYSKSKLKEIVIGDGVTTIGNYTFRYCSKVISITIPESVTSIGDYAFDGCNNVETTFYSGTKEQWNNISIGSYNYPMDSRIVYNCNSERPFYESGSCGENVEWILYADGTLVISGEGAMNDWSSDSYAPWYSYRSRIKSVVVEAGVTSIGNYAFHDYYTNLASVTLGDSVTNIGEYAFCNCTGLTSVTIGSSVTSISNYAFSGCTGLTSVTVPNSVTSIGSYAFSGCTELTSITISDNVISIGDSAFYNCKNITSVTIPDSVTSIGSSVFRDCTGLTSITISDNVISIGDSAFYNCKNITSVTIPDSVISIGSYAFYGCTELTSITIPDSITSIVSSVFSGCTGLTSVTIPDGVTSIGSSAFSGCTGLTSVTIPDSVTNIGSSAFFGCSGIKELKMPISADIHISSDIFNKCTNIEKITLTKGNGTVLNYTSSDYQYTPWYIADCSEIIIEDGVTSIAPYTFKYCSDLTSVTIPESVTNIGNDAFYGCSGIQNTFYPGTKDQWNNITVGSNNSSLTKYIVYNCNSDNPYYESGSCGETAEWILYTDGTLVISGTGAMSGWSWSSDVPWYFYRLRIKSVVVEKGVTSIGSYAFRDYTSLTSATIPDSITSIGSYVFYGCTGLTSVTIGDSVTSIGSSAFEGCTGLTSVTIGDGVTSIGYSAFYGCTRLTSITIPDSVTDIGSYAFYGCTGFTNVTIPDSVTSIGSEAFFGCSGIKELTIPVSASLSSSSFSGCVNIGKVTLTKGNGTVTSYYDSPWRISGCSEIIIEDGVTGIGSNAFKNCINITSITIPDSVTSIGFEAFFGCSGIKELTIPVSASLSSSSFSGCVNIGKVTLTKGNGTVTSYYDPPWRISGCSEIIIEDGVTGISDYAFRDCTNIANITIPDSVTSIGSGVFSGCTGLTSVTIGDGVTSIGDYAFYGCTGLENVYYTGDIADWCAISFSNESSNPMKCSDNLYIGGELVTDTVVIPDSVTSIGSYAFCSFTKLTSLTIGDGVTSIGSNAFYDCTGLTNVTIGDSVTSIGSNAFRGCTGLTSITIPDSVTSIGSAAFYDCSGLKELTMPISAKIYSDSFTFGKCINIEKITLTKGDGTVQSYSDSTAHSNTYYGYTPWYYSKDSLKELVIEEGITAVGSYTFYGCTGLTNITIPDSVVVIDMRAFYGCSGLAHITIGSGVTTIGEETFKNCSSLAGITVSDDNLMYSSDEKGVLFNKNKTMLIKYPAACESSIYVIPDSVIIIGNSAFIDCTALTSLIVPDSVTDIEGYAFRNSDSLVSVTIGNGVAVIGNFAFLDCDNLAEVTIGDSVTSIGISAFGNCISLENITLPINVQSIGRDAFVGCEKLATLRVYNRNCNFGTACTNSELTVIGYAGSTAEAYANEMGLEFEVIEACEHSNCHNEHKDSTCLNAGYDKVICDDCGAEVSMTELPLLDHIIKTVVVNPTCTEQGVEFDYCSQCSYAYVVEHIAPLGHSELVWVSIKIPSTRNEGIMNQVCPACGEVFDTKTVPAISLSADSTANIDFETNTISGFDSGSSSIGDYLTATNNGYTFTCESEKIATGTVITLTAGEDTINEFTAVIFGDTNGDGWYDGQDAIIVDCLANGMLTKDDVSEAVYMAADCNHDGVIDQLDVALLNEAGTLLANVDQTKPTEVLLETSSEYVEYLSLIDQSFEIETEEETEDIPEVDADETPETNTDVESEDTTPEQDEKVDVFEMIMKFIKSIFEILFAYIPVPLK